VFADYLHDENEECPIIFSKENQMTTILIIIVVLLVMGGGGWGYSRWRR
jgi:hypothetical protein